MIKSNGHFSCLAEGGYRQQEEASGVGEGDGGSGVYVICRINVNMMGCDGGRKHAIGLWSSCCCCEEKVVQRREESPEQSPVVASSRQKSPEVAKEQLVVVRCQWSSCCRKKQKYSAEVRRKSNILEINQCLIVPHIYLFIIFRQRPLILRIG